MLFFIIMLMLYVVTLWAECTKKHLSRSPQVLLTNDSARVHREVQRSLPTLRRLARAKLNDQQVALMSEVLDELCE